jgi:heme/copper-type cytochrome/quinol oxidase subunit 3
MTASILLVLVLLGLMVMLLDLALDTSTELFEQLANSAYLGLVKIVWISLLLVVFAALIYCTADAILGVLEFYHDL